MIDHVDHITCHSDELLLVLHNITVAEFLVNYVYPADSTGGYFEMTFLKCIAVVSPPILKNIFAPHADVLTSLVNLPFPTD